MVRAACSELEESFRTSLRGCVKPRIAASLADRAELSRTGHHDQGSIGLYPTTELPHLGGIRHDP